MMIKLKWFKPIYLKPLEVPEKYWMHPLCMGCYGKLVGLGIAAKHYISHLNPICLVKAILNTNEYMKYWDKEDEMEMGMIERKGEDGNPLTGV